MMHRIRSGWGTRGKPTKLLYWVLLPAMTAFCLLIVASSMPRPQFLGSVVIDFGTRLYLSALYGGALILFSDRPRFESWVMGRRQGGDQGVAGKPPKLWHAATSLVLFGFVVVMTHWAMRTFLPAFGDLAWPVAVAYGLIISVPDALNMESTARD